VKLLNVKDFFVVGLMAFVFIYLANWGLTKAGLGRFKA
jgi:hypothetical protein